MLGFASGVDDCCLILVTAGTRHCLSNQLNVPGWFPATIGFLLGGGFLYAVDKLLPHLHNLTSRSTAEGIHTSWRRSVLLVLAVSLHNVPEGLAVGVAFGAVSAGLGQATLGAAIALAIGIGLQNFPEGLAVSLPLRSDGLSAKRSFWWGQLSGIVEPMAAVIGTVSALFMQHMLPYALSLRRER